MRERNAWMFETVEGVGALEILVGSTPEMRRGK